MKKLMILVFLFAFLGSFAQFEPLTKTFKRLSDLTSNIGKAGASYKVNGRVVDGDDGACTVYWDPTSTATPVTGLVIQVTGVTTGRWIRVVSATGSKVASVITTAALQALSGSDYDYVTLRKVDDYFSNDNGLYHYNATTGKYSATGGGFWERVAPSMLEDGSTANGSYHIGKALAQWNTGTTGYGSATFSATKPVQMIILRNDEGEITNYQWGGMITSSAEGGAINFKSRYGDNSGKLELGTIDNFYTFTPFLTMVRSSLLNVASKPIVPDVTNTQTLGSSTLFFNKLFSTGIRLGITSATTTSGTASKALGLDVNGDVGYYDISGNPGSVTSVGTGYGLLGGPITSAGTINIDTFAMTTRVWHKKGMDSLGAIKQANISLTTTGSGASTFSSNILNIPIYTADETSLHAVSNVFSIKSTYTGQSSITTVGNLTGGALSTGFTPVTIPVGGTGLSTTTAYAIFTGGTASTSPFQQVSGVGTLNQYLGSNGAGALPSWKTLPSSSYSANTFLANNTSVTATPASLPYEDDGIQTYTGTLAWNATTNPSGGSTKQYRWIRIGNKVEVFWWLNFATAGTAVIGVQGPWPADMPLPAEPGGFTAIGDMLYVGKANLNDAGGLASGGTFAITKSAASTYRFIVTASSSTGKVLQAFLVYITSNAAP